MRHAAPPAPLPRRRRSGCSPATSFEAALTDLAAEGATGALTGADGTVHLLDGAVVHAESRSAADVGSLLTGCGRLAGRDWEDALLLSGGRLAEYLLASGQVGRGELELARLTALFDAAHFALGQDGGELRFDSAAVPHFRPARPLTVHELRGAIGRRRALLDRIWPSSRLDAAPLYRHGADPDPRAVPSRRRRAVLNAADGRLTAPRIARLLGRSSFGVLLDVRQLAAVGLLEAGQPAVAVPPPAAELPPPAPPAVLLPPPRAPGPPGYDPDDPEVGLLLRLRAALEAL